MPNYFFDITDGNFIPDLSGVELPDLAGVRAYAIALAGRLLTDNAAVFWKGEEWMIEARDDCGLELFTLVFRAREAPTVLAARPTLIS